MELSHQPSVIDRLVEAVQKAPEAQKESHPRVQVHAAISRFSVFYERLRMAIDYKEDHLHRRSAIVRILKRQLILETDPAEIAWQLMRELIAARYVQAHRDAEQRIAFIADSVKKYQVISAIHSVVPDRDVWLLEMTAVEIDERIVDTNEEKTFLHALYDFMVQRLAISDLGLQEEEGRLLVYLACLKTFLKADDAVLGYKLLRVYEQRWLTSEVVFSHAHDIALCLDAVIAHIRQTLKKEELKRLTSAIRPWGIALTLIRATMKEDSLMAKALIDEPEALKKSLARVTESRIQQSKKRLTKGMFRALIYLFITKWLFALALELPLERWLFGEVHHLPLFINLLSPLVIMLVVGLVIRPPVKQNTEVIAQLAEQFIRPPEGLVQPVYAARRYSIVAKAFLGLGYTGLFAMTFALIIWALHLIGYTWVSMMVFLFFLCVVSFFAYRLRQGVKEYVAYERPTGLTSLVIDAFSLPILHMGKLLSDTVSRYNVFVLLFDVLLEAPYKLFLQALEEWFYFMKEKKDQI